VRWISRIGVRLVGGIERGDIARGGEEFADLPELRQRDRRPAAAQLVQAVDVRLERGTLTPGPEGFIQIGVHPRDGHLPRTSAAPPSNAPARKVEKRPRSVSAATWSLRLAARIDTPSLRSDAELVSCGTHPPRRRTRVEDKDHLPDGGRGDLGQELREGDPGSGESSVPGDERHVWCRARAVAGEVEQRDVGRAAEERIDVISNASRVTPPVALVRF
jgi:hypothetical protein